MNCADSILSAIEVPLQCGSNLLLYCIFLDWKYGIFVGKNERKNSVPPRPVSRPFMHSKTCLVDNIIFGIYYQKQEKCSFQLKHFSDFVIFCNPPPPFQDIYDITHGIPRNIFHCTIISSMTVSGIATYVQPSSRCWDTVTGMVLWRRGYATRQFSTTISSTTL